MNKKDYESVATILNNALKKWDATEFEPRVSVVMFAGEYHLFTNNAAFSLTENKGPIQDMFYAGETYVVGDKDIYLEPAFGTRYFGLAY